MKTKLTYLLLLFAFLLLPFALFSQSPNKINYQAVARDGGGNPIASSNIYVRFTIHQNTFNGATVFQESHPVTTNAFGLFSLQIGAGTLLSGNINTIAWGSDLFFLEVEVDPDAGGAQPYVPMGTTQFLSVPYSLHSKTADSLTGGAGAKPWTKTAGNVYPTTLTDNVGIGTFSPNASSLLDITSTTRGILIPRMTGGQMTSIATPATGLMVYNTDSVAFCYYNGTVWKKIFSPGSAPANLWSRSAPNTFLTNNGDSVGIGVSAPTQAKVEIRKTGGATDAMFVSTNGTGRAVTIQSTNTGSSSAALKVSTSGSAPAGYFEITTATSNAIAVHGYTSGTGSAGLFQINNNSSSAHSLRATNVGSGSAVFASIASPGTGRAGYFENTNASNTSDGLYSTTNGSANSKAIYGKHTGTGVVYGVFGEATGSGGSVGVYGYASNASGTNNYGVAGFNQNPSSGYGVFGQGLYGVYGQNNSSSGYGVYGIANTAGSTAVAGFSNTNSGRAGHFEITGATNASSALYVKTVGTGLAGEFIGKIRINDGSAAANKILVSTDALGTAQWQALSASSFGGWSVFGNTGTVDGTHFIGTTDNIPLAFKVNNQKAGRIDQFLSSTFFGFRSGEIVTGNQNSAYGINSLLSTTTGGQNTAIGTAALQTNITGSNNTALGSFADVSGPGLSNATAIGANAVVSSSNSLVLGNNVNVGIGISNPSAKLHIHDGHLKSTQSNAPGFSTIALGGLTSIALDAGSTDVKGSVSSAGTISPNNVAVFKIIFNIAYTVAPIVVAAPAAAGALQLGVTIETTTTSEVTISIRNNSGSGISAPRINYIVIE